MPPPPLVALLAGETAAVAALRADTSAAAWSTLLAHVLSGAPPSAPLAAQLWAQQPSLPRWIRSARVATGELPRAARAEARRALAAWLADSLRRAFPRLHPGVGQDLLDRKLRRCGECPAASVERHNLGTVHARLGDRVAARALFEQSLRELERHAAPPETLALVRRSLARLDA